MSGFSDKNEIRKKVIGLGENSYRKSYYPQLQSQIGELTEQKNLLEKVNAELTAALEALKRTQKSLIINENKYHTLFENAGDAILILDAETFDVVDCNMKALRFLGFSSMEEMQLKDIFNIMPKYQPNGRPSEEAAREILGSAAKGKSIALEWVIGKADGSNAICNVSLNTIKLAGKIQIQTIIKDITELRALEYQQAMTSLRSVENERLRFSKELHDGIGPILSTVKLYLGCLEEECESDRHQMVIKKANYSIDEATRAIKEIAYDLSPHVLVNYGIESAIKHFIDNIVLADSLKVDFIYNIAGGLHADFEILLYRIITELINNTIKHANASKVDIDVEKINDSLMFNYSDNGVGFDVNARDGQKGMGLNNIRNRIKEVGGYVEIQSEINKGFEFRFFIQNMNYLT